MSSDDDVEFIGDNNDENVGGRASGRTKRKVSYIDSDSGSDALEESDEFEEEAHAEKKTKSSASASKKKATTPSSDDGAAKSQAKGKASKSTVNDTAENKAGKALRDAAVQNKMLSTKMPTDAAVSKPSKEIQTYDGLDLVKKSGGRKKYLFSFPGQLNDLRAGQIGEITAMDTQNPVVYIDWAGEGRLKLTGTIVNPKAKLLLLKKEKVKGNESVVCDQVFENMIIFSEYKWIGKPEENPKEDALDIPAKLSQEIVAKAKTGSDTKPTKAEVVDADARRSGRERKGPKSYAEPGDKIEAKSDSDSEEEAGTVRKAPTKKVKVEVADDDVDEGAESSGSDILERFSTAGSAAKATPEPNEGYAWGGVAPPSKSPAKTSPAKWTGWADNDSGSSDGGVGRGAPGVL